MDVEQRGKSWVIKKGARAKLDKAYLDMLKALKLEPAPAGGLQSLISGGDVEPDDTPRRTGTPAIPPKDGGTPKEGGVSAKQSSKKTEQAAQAVSDQPGYTYIVTASSTQKGMKTTSVSLRLRGADGKEITAFAQGEHPLLVPGTMLASAKLTTRKQDTVVYYVLESYKIAEPQGEAA